MSGLILTYHSIEDGRGPLFVSPDLFERHIEAILESGSVVLTVAQLAALLRDGRLPERAVAITFDDGFQSVAHNAAPLLIERGLTATVFCVAGRLGADNGWPSQPSHIPRRALASAGELADLARSGLEIGAHGFDHSPIVEDDTDLLHREVVDARAALEDAVGTSVVAFAFPYGVRAAPSAGALVARTYEAACTARLAPVRATDYVLSLPRVDAHYVRQPALLRRALSGDLRAYLGVRALGSRARRSLQPDFAKAHR